MNETSLELALQLERLQVAHVPLVVEEVLLQPEPGVQFNRYFCQPRIRPRTWPKSCLEFPDMYKFVVP